MRTIPHVVWFKRDLRIADHAALALAAANGPVVALYMVEPAYWQLPDTSRRHWHFLHDSLQALAADLAGLGIPLTCRIGEATEILEALRQQLGGFTLCSHEETGNGWTFARDLRVAAWCRAQGIPWHELPSHGVVRRLKSRDGWVRERDARMQAPCLELPALSHAPLILHSDPIPAKDDTCFGSAAIGTVQAGGRSEGLRVLSSFLGERSRRYMQTISKPGPSARHCSRLSAHIAYGTISVREIVKQTQEAIVRLKLEATPDAASHARNLRAFLSRMAWRCHFVQKLEQWPDLEYRCMHPAFEGMREPHAREDYFTAWATGRTGYPLVDAAMRSLHANGWITFRMRAMLVSFASYHLWLDWRLTAPHLAGLFTDYEPGIHYAQFQMQSGVTGINAIRMYNPIKQGMEHDAEGKFIRRFVPELRDVPTSWIHEPWRMDTPPAGYSAPIVAHTEALRHARAEIGKRRKLAGFRDEAQQVFRHLGSRNRPPAQRRKPAQPTRQLSLQLE